MAALPKRVFAHFRRGEFDKADRACVEFLERQPENADAWHIRGILALGRREFAEAKTYLSRALDVRADDSEILTNYGIAMIGTRDVAGAAGALARAIELDPNCAEAHLNLARCHLRELRLDDADRSLASAFAVRSVWPEAKEVKAAIAMRRGKYEEAFTLANEVIAEEPARSDAYRIVADIYTRDGQYKEGFPYYQAAIERNPYDVEALSNFGVLLARAGWHTKAVTNFRKALSLEPDNAPSRFALSLSLLAQGQFQEGWTDFEARLKIPDNVLATRPMAAPRLRRLPREGERVLAWGDQGLGEQIMFASLMPDLIATGATISLECNSRLVSLFTRSFPKVEVLPSLIPPHPRFSEPLDGQFALPDAGAWLRPDFAAFPRHSGYLKPNQILLNTLRQRYSRDRTGQPLIGISWRTAPNLKFSKHKSVPLPSWAPVLRTRGATFVSLQYGAASDEIQLAELDSKTTIVSDPEIDPSGDIDAFAAQVAAMDLVITTSNTTAHLAGALNVPTWTLVAGGFGGLWHWFLERDNSPWYPAMRLFRQQLQGDWQPVLESVAEALGEFLAQWPNHE
jgi:Tfp pilus assembly protein PilF